MALSKRPPRKGEEGILTLEVRQNPRLTLFRRSSPVTSTPVAWGATLTTRRASLQRLQERRAKECGLRAIPQLNRLQLGPGFQSEFQE